MRKQLNKGLKLALDALTHKLVLIPLMVAAAGFLVLSAPQIQKDYIRSEVGSRVYRITRDASATSGGTGFQVEAPSGQSYILTNAHICEIYGPGAQNILVQLHNGQFMPRRILQISDKTDLCIAEGIPNTPGLKLGGELQPGDNLQVVGHPKLMDLVISDGQAVERTEIKLLAGYIGKDEEMMTEEQCKSQPKNSIIEENTMQLTPNGITIAAMKVCVTTIHAMQTNAVGQPGNSGSPVVNMFGNVEGVLFAGDNEVFWSLIVPVEDVRDFLAAY